jgi:hypothetical protein
LAAYAFNGASYVSVDTFRHGVGYWLKLDSDAPWYPIVGRPLETDTFEIRRGWNLIGSASFPIEYATFESVPSGLVVSQLFEYAGEYRTSSTIEPGKAYWIRAGANGRLIATRAAPASLRKTALHIEAINSLPPSPPGMEAESEPIDQPGRYFLEQNYPNPFNPSTSIRYVLPSEQYVLLRVFNVLGQVVLTLVDGTQGAGPQMVTCDASMLPSGVYFYKLEAGAFTSVRSMLVMR